MGFKRSKIMTFVLIEVLFFSLSSVYAETAEEYANRGNAHNQQGNFAQAVSDYTKAIEMNPNYAGAYYGRVMVYYNLKEYGKAWADVHKAESLGMKADPTFLIMLKEASGRDK